MFTIKLCIAITIAMVVGNVIGIYAANYINHCNALQETGDD